MTVTDLWQGLSKQQIAERRATNRDRWQRRWPEGIGREARQRKQGYKEHQRAQAHLDDANQMGNPKARGLRLGSITVGTLLDRHLAAKGDRAASTVEVDRGHAGHVRAKFGDRVVTTLDTTEIEIWSARSGVAAESRKMQIEITRAAIKRGIRDKPIDSDPTEGIVVSLGHRERPSYSSTQLIAILESAASDADRALLGALGLMGLRSGEARSLRVGNSIVGNSLFATAVQARTRPRPGRPGAPFPFPRLFSRGSSGWRASVPRRRGSSPVPGRRTHPSRGSTRPRCSRARSPEPMRIGARRIAFRATRPMPSGTRSPPSRFPKPAPTSWRCPEQWVTRVQASRLTGTDISRRRGWSPS